MFNNKVVATDGVNDGIVVKLTGKEAQELDLKENIMRDTIKKVAVDDSAEYEEVYDFKKLAEGTDMNYHGVSSNTDVVYWNGMDNTEFQAQKTQEMIQKDFPDISVGLMNNKTGEVSISIPVLDYKIEIPKIGIVKDYGEWKANYLTTKDVLNAHKLQELQNNAHVITHSAGNEDIYKANEVNALVNAKTPYIHTSVGSPTSETKLRESGKKVGAKFNSQINSKHDPVANGFVNRDANYNKKNNLLKDLSENHPFQNYYKNEGLKEEIKGLKERNND